MKNKSCRISDAEWLIMKVLWEESPLNTTKIIEVLKSSSDWKPKTIHTLISRLVKKGALGILNNTVQHEFYPLVKKEDCVMEETKSFVQKAYDGSFYKLIANFIKEDKMSLTEIKKLREMFDEKIEHGKDDGK